MNIQELLKQQEQQAQRGGQEPQQTINIPTGDGDVQISVSQWVVMALIAAGLVVVAAGVFVVADKEAALKMIEMIHALNGKRSFRAWLGW
jgi:hypothetical protein